MNIMLISPPALGLHDKIAYPPLGLMYLASNLDNLEGKHSIKIANMLTFEECIDYTCDLYGISIHSPASFTSAKQIIERIREHNKEALIIVGGAFPTSMYQFVKESLKVDIVVCGEGEKTFNFIVKCYEIGRTDKNAWRLQMTLIENLDDIKFPARHLLPYEMIRYEGNVHHTSEPATTILATRGCPYICNFCDTTMWKRKYRTRSPENIAQEIEQVRKDYKINWFRFPDDCLTINKEWFNKFCQRIKELKIKWTMLSRADTINIEQLELAKTSGCQEVFFGIESGSQRILDLMNKKITVEQNAKAIQLCKEVGIKSCVYMMFGFPGENEESVYETIKFLKKTQPDKSRIHQFLPIPNTQVCNNQAKYGIKVKNNFDDYWDFLDNPNLTLDYDYIGNDKIFALREIMKQFYIDSGYKDNLYV